MNVEHGGRSGAVLPTELGRIRGLYGDWSLTGGTDPDGNPINMQGRSTEIMRRQPDGAGATLSTIRIARLDALSDYLIRLGVGADCGRLI